MIFISSRGTHFENIDNKPEFSCKMYIRFSYIWIYLWINNKSKEKEKILSEGFKHKPFF